MRPLVLVNSNVSRPPVSPVGLEYVGQATLEAGWPVEVIDLAFEGDGVETLVRRLSSLEPVAVGISVRNTDDCCLATRESFLPWICRLVQEVKRVTGAPVVLGGVGFSIYDDIILQLTGADLGIAGDGEGAMPDLVERLWRGREYSDLPNLVYRSAGRIVCNPRVGADLERFPIPRRRLFNNLWYERQGAMVGVETKRGCVGSCIYCADPVAKGKRVRLRPPRAVVEEMRDLVEQGVTWFHLSDSEFNLPPEHARDVCEALVEAKLGSKVRWYCYCSPLPFDRKLANLMVRAGCAGVNFGVDSLCDEQLARLGRSHRLAGVEDLLNVLRENGLNFMFDLLVGGPGETQDTVRATVEQTRRLGVPLVGMALGIRVYRGTPLWRLVVDGDLQGAVHPAGVQDFAEPAFFLSPALGADPWGLVRGLIGEDVRFMLLSAPGEVESYNYINAGALDKAIEQGARGAYWDILRKLKGLG